MGVYLLRRNGDILTEKARESLSFALARRTAQVDEWLGDRVRELGRWSSSFVLYEGLPALRGTGVATERALRDLNVFLESLLRNNAVYESLFVTDLRGETLVSTAPETLDEPVRASLRAGSLPSGRLTAIFRSPHLGRPTLLSVQPVQDRNLQTVGYLVGRVDLKLLEARLGAPIGEPAAFFTLVDGEGRIVARKGHIVPDPGTERAPPEISAGLQTAGGVSAPVRRFGRGAGALLISTRALEGPSRGFLVLSLPESVAYASLGESRRAFLAGGVSLVLLALILTFLVAAQVLRPVRRLAEGARRLSDGDLEVQIPPGGRDEIGDLTVAFNSMSRNVLEGRRNLEQARDDLARSNAELRRTNEALERLAITDGLTGLYNHRHFQECWQRATDQAEREGYPASLLMIDLDHFKDYNDRYGHTAGDEALREVADALRSSLRNNDFAFRYGGEELTVILPVCESAAAAKVGEKIRQILRALPRSAELPQPPTVSIGVASFPADGASPREVLDRADAALYVAKSEGRDRVVPSRGRVDAPGVNG
jgi:diguanylate cyclase (GGDEF)-like protein